MNFRFNPFLALIFASAGFASTPQPAADLFRIVTENASGLVIELDADRLEISNATTLDESALKVSLEGAQLTNIPGRPQLPAVVKLLAIPPRCSARLEIVSDAPERQRLLRPIAGMGGETDVPFRPEQGLFPPQPASLGDPMVMRGLRLVPLAIYPAQYNYDTGELITHRNLTVEIVFEPDDAPNGALLPFQERRNRSPEFSRVIEALVPNAPRLQRDNAQREYQGNYLVVTHDSCLTYAIPFLEWKRTSGNKVQVLSYPHGFARDAGNIPQIQEDVQDIYDNYLESGQDPFDYILLIGDRRNNVGNAPWILEAPHGTPSQEVRNHGDYVFGLLEGDDFVGDAAVGRIGSGNRDMMELAVARLLSYEKEPWMQDPSWFGRGGVYSQRWGEDYDNSIPHSTRWGEEVLERLGFDEIRVQEADAPDDGGGIIGPVLARWFNERTCLLIGRAENHYWLESLRGVVNNTAFPVMINTCGHGEEPMENMFRTGDADNLKGTVTVITGWGNPTTINNNSNWLSLVNSILLEDMSMGWGRVVMGADMMTVFYDPEEHEEITRSKRYQTDTDLYGNPGLHPWIGVPRMVDVEAPEEISPFEDNLIVIVTEDESPVEGAVVALYLPGEMPEPEDYAEWEPAYMTTRLTNAEGVARFILPGDLPEGAITVTVTGRDLYPHTSEVMVRSVAASVIPTDFENDLDSFERGGEYALVFGAHNLGSAAVHNLSARLEELSPWLTLGEEEIQFGTVAAGQSSQDNGSLAFTVHPAAPNGSHQMTIQFLSDEGEWQTDVEVYVNAPHLKFSSTNPVSIDPGETSDLDIELVNDGMREYPGGSARLLSPGWAMTVDQAVSQYDPIAPLDDPIVQSGNRFRVTASPRAIPGMLAPLALIMGEGMARDTVAVTLQLGQSHPGAPFGPDAYGYACWDDTDTNWVERPRYNWVEISQDLMDFDYPGNRIVLFQEIPAPGRENGRSIVVDLPINFRFYGEEFNQLTICSNGFLGIGDQERMINFQNYPLDMGVGAAMGTIAPFWDDLKVQGQGASVWFYADLQSGRFIVEWYQLRTISDGDTLVTFETILYDADQYPTETGDSRILFNYSRMAQVYGDAADMPYASVGISSPDGTTGLSYTFRNVYPVAAAPLANRRSILFMTVPDFGNDAPDNPVQPVNWELGQSYPNPFNSSTVIPFSIAAPSHITLNLYGLDGRLIACLKEGHLNAGRHQVTVELPELPAGMFIYRLETANFSASRKLVLVK